MREPLTYHAIRTMALTLIIATAWVALLPARSQRESSVVRVTNNGWTESSFCTANGKIFVVHGGWKDAYGDYALGNTLITGPGTFRLGPGNANVTKGCYTHKVERATVMGNAWAQSTIWYDAP